jgi:hypothetical protein
MPPGAARSDEGDNNSTLSTVTIARRWYVIVTLFLHCCYTVVTLLLHCCYTVVTLLLHCCYTVVALFLHCCYTAVTLLLHCCYSVVTLLLHFRYLVITLLLHCALSSVLTMDFVSFHRCDSLVCLPLQPFFLYPKAIDLLSIPTLTHPSPGDIARRVSADSADSGELSAGSQGHDSGNLHSLRDYRSSRFNSQSRPDFVSTMSSAMYAPHRLHHLTSPAKLVSPGSPPHHSTPFQPLLSFYIRRAHFYLVVED